MGLNIHLTPQLEAWVRSQVASGLYASPTELVSEALRLLEAHDDVPEAKLALLRADIQKGLISGPSAVSSADDLKREARARRASRAV